MLRDGDSLLTMALTIFSNIFRLSVVSFSLFYFTYAIRTLLLARISVILYFCYLCFFVEMFKLHLVKILFCCCFSIINIFINSRFTFVIAFLKEHDVIFSVVSGYHISR